MAEVIITKFSPNETVTWNRTEKNVSKTSEHLVKSVHTETINQFKFTSIKGTITFMEGAFLSICAALSINREQSTKLSKHSNELLKQVKDGGFIRNTGIGTSIKYRLDGVEILVKESELTLNKNGE